MQHNFVREENPLQSQSQGCRRQRTPAAGGLGCRSRLPCALALHLSLEERLYLRNRRKRGSWRRDREAQSEKSEKNWEGLIPREGIEFPHLRGRVAWWTRALSLELGYGSTLRPLTSGVALDKALKLYSYSSGIVANSNIYPTVLS